MNKEINATEAFNLMQREDVALIDVREDTELQICKIDGALHIPMNQIPNHLDSLPKDKTFVLFCHHGMRSLHVLQYLEAQGYENLLNLTGGIDAWATQVDPNMQRY